MRNRLNGFLWLLFDIICNLYLINIVIFIAILTNINIDIYVIIDQYQKQYIDIGTYSVIIASLLLLLTSSKSYYYLITFNLKGSKYPEDNIVIVTDSGITYKNINKELLNNEQFKELIVKDFTLLKKENNLLSEREHNIIQFKEWINKSFFN